MVKLYPASDLTALVLLLGVLLIRLCLEVSHCLPPLGLREPHHFLRLVVAVGAVPVVARLARRCAWLQGVRNQNLKIKSWTDKSKIYQGPKGPKKEAPDRYLYFETILTYLFEGRMYRI